MGSSVRSLECNLPARCFVSNRACMRLSVISLSLTTGRTSPVGLPVDLEMAREDPERIVGVCQECVDVIEVWIHKVF